MCRWVVGPITLFGICGELGCEQYAEQGSKSVGTLLTIFGVITMLVGLLILVTSIDVSSDIGFALMFISWLLFSAKALHEWRSRR